MPRTPNLAEEIEHLLSFGWSAQRISDRLGCNVTTIEKRIARNRLKDLATAELATVYSRQSTERGNW